MMPIDPKEEMAQLRGKITRTALLETPGTILLGLALYGKFAVSPGSLHPLLENSGVTTTMAIVGGAIAAWGAIKIRSIAKRITELQNNSGA